MCLILFGYATEPGLPLVVAANRDEFHARPAATADFWSDFPQVLAGRDLQAGGTWLGCTRQGRFAALTNFSDPSDPAKPRSRGTLVQDFLTTNGRALDYANNIALAEFAGFNLLVFDGENLVYVSNRTGVVEALKPGYYGLSNAELGATWPKCVRGAAQLQKLKESEATHDAYVALMADQAVPSDDELPARGRDIEFERRVAPCFILGDEYGTRASSVLTISRNTINFTEQSYVAGGKATEQVAYNFEYSTEEIC